MLGLKNSRGFTLIEVAISLLVMSIVIGALLQAFQTFSLKDSGVQTLARLNFAASSKLEAVTSKRYALITNEAFTSIPGFTGFYSQVVSEYVSAEALDTAKNADTGYKRITVRVTSLLGTAATIEVKGLVTNASN